MRTLLLTCVVALATLTGVGAARADITVDWRGPGAAPPLVYVQPDVWAIANYDVPVFYAYGYYWRPVDGYWYRSGAYTHGWVYDPAPPLAILRINQPYRYTYYRPYGYDIRRRAYPQQDWRFSRAYRAPAIQWDRYRYDRYRTPVRTVDRDRYRYNRPYARPMPRDRYYDRNRGRGNWEGRRNWDDRNRRNFDGARYRNYQY